MTPNRNNAGLGPDAVRTPSGRTGNTPGRVVSRASRRFRGKIGGATVLAAVLLLIVWRPGMGGEPVQATWFAGYVDVTVSPVFNFETATTRDIVLSFIVASPADPCRPSWGSSYGLDEAGEAFNLDERLKSHVFRGGRVGVSFGGALNEELASSCLDEERLTSAYRAVIDRYHPVALDFDLEGANISDLHAGVRRARVVASLQQERGLSEPKLEVWLTLPASPRGLTDEGITAVDQMLKAGVQLSGVNIMTMNYGQSRVSSQSMLDAATSAATATHDQLNIAYRRAGQNLSSNQLWEKMGVTPMIGQNDLRGEIFDLAAADGLRKFAVERGIQRLSMWSLNRDIACRPDQQSDTASHGCSGIIQDAGQFSKLLGDGLPGRLG